MPTMTVIGWRRAKTIGLGSVFLSTQEGLSTNALISRWARHSCWRSQLHPLPTLRGSVVLAGCRFCRIV